ncbi:MAG: nuclear transport factor 2 family protein [Halioglobus sp.]
MLSPEETRALITSYVDMMCKSDVEGIMALYADDATAEDPVGGEPVQGIEAVREFYAMTAPLLQVELTGPICVAGNACAFPLLAELTMGDVKSYLNATDVFTFTDEGKISSMKAYWSLEELRPER